jgi:pyrimidine-specific ribonucleoside hydrolase
MADLGMPAPTMQPDARIAVELLRESVVAAAEGGEPVTLVPLAPMTNVALFARTHPEAFARLRRIVFMGGGAEVSNATASAEFNVFHDPEATALVLDACAEHGVPVTMYGLDVFYEPRVTARQSTALAALGTPAATLAAGLSSFHQRLFDDGSMTIGDAGAVAILLRPDAVRTERRPVRVELAGTWTRGRTIVDRRDWAGAIANDPHGVAPASVEVCLGIDADAIRDLWLATVRGEL